MHVYTVEQMRALERAADAAGYSYAAMMEQAGRAVAQAIVARLGEATEARKRVVVLVGPGNNGGDGLVAARELSGQGYSVVAYLLPRDEGDALLGEARRYGVAVLWAAKDNGQRLAQALSQAGVIVDALFGTGLSRPIEGVAGEILARLRQVRESEAPVSPLRSLHATPPPAPSRPLLVAVDVPSGLRGDTGEVALATVAADLTVTFAGPKLGMLTPTATEVLGELLIADIGIPPAVRAGAESAGRLLSLEVAASLLPPRPVGGHKGTFGTTLVVGGSLNYVGAPALSAQAAGRSGAGLVTLGVPAPLQPLLAGHAELTTATWLLLPHDMGVLRAEAVPVVAEGLRHADALVLGPGLGAEEATRQFVWALFGLGEGRTGSRFVGFVAREEAEVAAPPALPPTVVDADALNALAAWEGSWWESVRTALVLTPHPGEMARLLGREIGVVQAARLEMAREAAARFRQVVVLKGAHTVVAAPDGRVSFSPFANDALAKAGSGDVLAGIIGALLGQGMEPYEAACLGVSAHGLAGDRVRQRWGGQGALASDLLASLPEVWERIRQAAGLGRA